MLKQKWNKILFIVILLLAVGCSNESETTGAPVPAPPPVTTNPGGFPTNNTVFSSPGLPDLSSAVPMALTDSVNLSAINELASDFSAPLVGDPLVNMDLEETSGEVTGSILFSFEDQVGFWGALIGHFGGTGRFSNNQLDVIFADDELVMRTIGSVTGSTLTGTVHYRVRQANENQCKPVVVYCNVSITQPQTPLWWFPAPNFPEECNQTPNVDTPCLSYMNTSQSEVKSLGSYSTIFSNWVE